MHNNTYGNTNNTNYLQSSSRSPRSIINSNILNNHNNQQLLNSNSTSSQQRLSTEYDYNYHRTTQDSSHYNSLANQQLLPQLTSTNNNHTLSPRYNNALLPLQLRSSLLQNNASQNNATLHTQSQQSLKLPIKKVSNKYGPKPMNLFLNSFMQNKTKAAQIEQLQLSHCNLVYIFIVDVIKLPVIYEGKKFYKYILCEMQHIDQSTISHTYDDRYPDHFNEKLENVVSFLTKGKVILEQVKIRGEYSTKCDSRNNKILLTCADEEKLPPNNCHLHLFSKNNAWLQDDNNSHFSLERANFKFWFKLMRSKLYQRVAFFFHGDLYKCNPDKVFICTKADLLNRADHIRKFFGEDEDIYIKIPEGTILGYGTYQVNIKKEQNLNVFLDNEVKKSKIKYFNEENRQNKILSEITWASLLVLETDMAIKYRKENELDKVEFSRDLVLAQHGNPWYTEACMTWRQETMGNTHNSIINLEDFIEGKAAENIPEYAILRNNDTYNGEYQLMCDVANMLRFSGSVKKSIKDFLNSPVRVQKIGDKKIEITIEAIRSLNQPSQTK